MCSRGGLALGSRTGAAPRGAHTGARSIRRRDLRERVSIVDGIAGRMIDQLLYRIYCSSRAQVVNLKSDQNLIVTKRSKNKFNSFAFVLISPRRSGPAVRRLNGAWDPE